MRACAVVFEINAIAQLAVIRFTVRHIVTIVRKRGIACTHNANSVFLRTVTVAIGALMSPQFVAIKPSPPIYSPARRHHRKKLAKPAQPKLHFARRVPAISVKCRLSAADCIWGLCHQTLTWESGVIRGRVESSRGEGSGRSGKVGRKGPPYSRSPYLQTVAILLNFVPYQFTEHF